MRLPSIADVASALRSVKRYCEKGDDCDVRLQVYDDGQWAVHFGDPGYDLDHCGHWGASCIDARSNCRELAKELLDQVADSVAMIEPHKPVCPFGGNELSCEFQQAMDELEPDEY